MIPQFLRRDEIVSATRNSETMERSLTLFFHTRITDAIAKRDGDAAEFWMIGHLSQIEEDVSHAQSSPAARTAGRGPSRRRATARVVDSCGVRR